MPYIHPLMYNYVASFVFVFFSFFFSYSVFTRATSRIFVFFSDVLEICLQLLHISTIRIRCSLDIYIFAKLVVS